MQDWRLQAEANEEAERLPSYAHRIVSLNTRFEHIFDARK